MRAQPRLPPYTTTQFVARLSPESILYTGARDGLVTAWDLNISMSVFTTLNNHVTRNSSSCWELFTGWLDQLLMIYLARAMNSTVIVIFLAMSGVALGVAG